VFIWYIFLSYTEKNLATLLSGEVRHFQYFFDILTSGDFDLLRSAASVVAPPLQLRDVIACVLLAPAAAAVAQALQNADDGDAQEEGHEAAELRDELE
jgi:hypothetical protein